MSKKTSPPSDGDTPEKKILIDSVHPEETRVAFTNKGVLEHFHYEIPLKRSCKGNVYLATVTNVEPSLQAAFVSFGGNRDGFLPFDQIHPDYYKIPLEDRQSLITELGAEVQESSEDPTDLSSPAETDGDIPENRATKNWLKRYKIQEVIHKNQLILVQVVKDERGTKGAALTTYLSFPGRFCVFMPNTPRGSALSKKISDAKTRTRLKKMIKDLEIPEAQGIILRTACSDRTKVEIKRDYDYLQRLWTKARDKTLKATAPSLVYQEGSLIQTTLRDTYDKDIESVEVQGERGYEEAKDLMRQMMPSHLKKISHNTKKQPLFSQYNLEKVVSSLMSPTVDLPSGGYLVINQTEALVAIDVNSGKARKERMLWETAFKTNLEAADEVARQLRLRDLSGLIVIDFIDMDKASHNMQVEQRLDRALKTDRARIQKLGISPLGLLELSRQRLQTSFKETVQTSCLHCDGSGHTLSLSALSLSALRDLQDSIITHNLKTVHLKTTANILTYLMNHKRDYLSDLENTLSCKIHIQVDDTLGQESHSLALSLDGKTQKKPKATKNRRDFDQHTSERAVSSAQKKEAPQDRAERHDEKPRTPSRKAPQENLAPEKRRSTSDAAASVSAVLGAPKLLIKKLLQSTRIPVKAAGQRFGHKKKLATKARLNSGHLQPALTTPKPSAFKKDENSNSKNKTGDVIQLKNHAQGKKNHQKTGFAPKRTESATAKQSRDNLSAPAADEHFQPLPAAKKNELKPPKQEANNKKEAPKKSWWQSLLG